MHGPSPGPRTENIFVCMLQHFAKMSAGLQTGLVPAALYTSPSAPEFWFRCHSHLLHQTLPRLPGEGACQFRPRIVSVLPGARNYRRFCLSEQNTIQWDIPVNIPSEVRHVSHIQVSRAAKRPPHFPPLLLQQLQHQRVTSQPWLIPAANIYRYMCTYTCVYI